MSLPKRKSGTATENFLENETGKGLVPFHNKSQNCQIETEEKCIHSKASCIGDDNIPPGTKTDPQIEEVLVRDENTNDFYAIVLHCGQ